MIWKRSCRPNRSPNSANGRGPEAEPTADGHGSVLDPLSGLVARSLVQVDEHGTAKRFRLLEVVRQYAAEHLEQCGEVGTVSLRHATYYCELAEQAERKRRGPERPRWRVRLRDEDANFRTALRWVLDTGTANLPYDWLAHCGGIGSTHPAKESPGCVRSSSTRWLVVII